MKIAILIPCLNEELTVASVVLGFRAALPQAEIYVFDNGSTDATAARARAAGAMVFGVPERGKGNVVNQMFRQVDADIYVMVDGDDTYPSEQVQALVGPLLRNEKDMMVAARVPERPDAFPKFHRLGNRAITQTVNLAFGSRLTDILSGYRALSREMVRALPLLCRGFEVEAEITLQALDKGFRIGEAPVAYRQRPEGSKSKLNTFTDGFLVMKTILSIAKNYRPLAFFSLISLLSLIGALGFGSVVIAEFIRTHQVHHPSTAVLASSLMIISIVSMIAGLILDSIIRHFVEIRLLLTRQLNRVNYLRPVQEELEGSERDVTNKRKLSL